MIALQAGQVVAAGDGARVLRIHHLLADGHGAETADDQDGPEAAVGTGID